MLSEIGSPAHAGVDLSQGLVAHSLARFPRTRGDRPKSGVLSGARNEKTEGHSVNGNMEMPRISLLIADGETTFCRVFASETKKVS